MGVDYSSSMLNIQDNHAYDIKNFLKNNGTLQKRPPVEQVGNHKLNGVWQCNFKGGIYTIAHIGTDLYLVDDINKCDSFDNNYHRITEENVDYGIKDQKSWGVFANDRLYILCGNYLVVKWEVDEDTGTIDGLVCKEVYDDVDTYVPTTTIGISTQEGMEAGIKRASLDNPNMLSPYRENSINAHFLQQYKTETDTGYIGKFYLDSNVDLNSNIYIRVNLIDKTDENKKKTFYLTKDANNKHRFETFYGQNKSDPVDPTAYAYIGEDAEGWYLEFAIVFPSILMIDDDLTNDNLVIRYSNGINESHLITKCTFGVMYGAGGNRNRLFVTGNPDKPNVDYHTSRRNIYASNSDVDLLDSQDLTYFSTYDYCGYGTSNTAITDYQIMGDGSLMVLKEESINEPNIYFRDSNYQTKTIALGDTSTEVVEETYPMRVGNIGEGALKGTKETLHNLNNDLVFISNNGVFGISSTVSAGQLNSDYKYSYSRSRLINSKLAEYLREAINVACIVYDHKYFITIRLKDNTYKTFVGDGRYSYKLKDSIDNEYEYEWFVLDGINAEQYHIINEKLYYSSNNGLFKFDLFGDYNTYADTERIFFTHGDLSQQAEEYIVNENIDLSKLRDSTDSYFEINENYEYYYFLENQNVVNQYLKNSLEDEVYCYYNNSLIRFYAKEKENYYNEFDFYKDVSMTTNLDFVPELDSLYVKANNQLLKVFILKEDDTEMFYLIDKYGEYVFLQSKETIRTPEATNIIGSIVTTKNIPCYYLTKSYNFGQSVYSKHLKSMTVINDSELFSNTNFSIITKEIKKRFEENNFSGTKGLVDTYENIFKADLTTGEFATSFTKDYLLKFNFIQFEFYNNDDTNCVINNFTILYTTGFKQKGVS